MERVAILSSSPASCVLAAGLLCSTTHRCSAFRRTFWYIVNCGETWLLIDECCMIAWQSGHRMFLKVRRRPPVCPLRTIASAQWWCSTWPQPSRIAGAAPRGSVQHMGHHSSASGSFRLDCGQPAASIDEFAGWDGVEEGGAELLEALWLRHSAWRQGKQRSSPRTPPHQWPQSACLLPHARLSFSAQDSDGGNLLRSVPSSLPQQEEARLSERLILAMHGWEHQRHDPTGHA
mmetsp:Transcript_63091/g.162451  ORF Transcript_63091/g.162451 Transcript_63091/m.162451 type:complete len:233 (-) Transcript_63091:714-1412(-)